MNDPVFQGFLQRQLDEGLALAAASDILELQPMGRPLPQHFLAAFKCRGVVQTRGDQIGEVGRCVVGIFFPPDYLRRALVPEVVTWLEPLNVFHPNIRPPFVCVGRLEPGTGLVDLLFQVFEIFVYRNFNPREDDCLNQRACAWARNNQHRFPIDPRPLKRLVAGAPPAGVLQGGVA